MNALERKIFLRGLRMDFGVVYNFPNLENPFTIGKYLLPAYRKGFLDEGIMKGGLSR
jgi:hypothetical protein